MVETDGSAVDVDVLTAIIEDGEQLQLGTLMILCQSQKWTRGL